MLALSTAIPAAPGSLGTYEFAGVTALGVLGIGPSQALAATVLIHVIATLPPALLGLVATLVLHVRIADIEAAGTVPAKRLSGGIACNRQSTPRPVAAAPLDVVVLGGGGHVGLPLSLALADSGLRVGIHDINQATLDGIRAGTMPFREEGADELLRRVLPTGRLALSADPAMVGDADIVIVVIGTPVDEFLGPSMTIFERAVDQIAGHLRDGALVILRSTVYPGTTEYVAQALAERGRRVDVAFCPERIAEGHALEELRTLPQIVGADDPRVGDRAEALFRTAHGPDRPDDLEGSRARRSCSRTRGAT